MKRIYLALAMAAAAANVSAISPLWLRDVRISPDGREIAFGYKGDIYVVNSSGGEARRITSGPSYESAPVWSPDSKTIAYASDRNGGSSIYTVDARGGQPRRVTFDSRGATPEAFTPDGKSIVYTAAIQDPAKSAMAPFGVMSELYSIPVEGGRPTQILGTPALGVSYLGDGKSFVYEDKKGFEDKWRKHHTSSITRDIWLYDANTGHHTNLTDIAGEDRNPTVGADGKTVYFLSERNGGSFNVYSMNLDKPGSVKALTDFTTHPVRFLSRGGNDLLAFTYNGELYTMRPGAKAEKLKVDVVDDDLDEPSDISFSRASEAAVSPDGKQVAFINRGEVFVTSTEYKSTKQITHTPAMEYGLSWDKDGRGLYYTSLRDGRSNIYHATIARKDDPNFSNATLVNEEPMFKADGVERSYPMVSPDGKKMAFMEDRNNLMVMDLDTKAVKPLLEHVSNYRSDGTNMEWSPDSRMIAVEVMNPSHEPYSDISIIRVADAEVIPVTRTGYFDQNPHWSADGNAVIFASERYGMRNHASWGSQSDVMMTFLNKDAYDKFRLNEEDFALLKEVEKEQKKAADDKDKADRKKKKKDDSKAETEESKEITIDRNGLEERTVRLTPNSSELADYALSDDGETLYYLSAFEGGYDLWKKELRKDEVELDKKLDASPAAITKDNDGNLYLVGSTVKKYVPSSSKLTPVDISGKVKLDPAKEREAMLEYVRNEARERFYLPEMPVDWDMYVDNYRRFLPHINNNYDFASLLSELLGELNVSHSGGRYYGPGANEATASLGLLYDMTYDGDGMKVDEIIAGGPFDRATTRLKKGDIIESINGSKLEAGSDASKLLNGITGKKTLVGILDPATGSRWDEVILPVSNGRTNGLLYNRWVKSREKAVDSLSNGRLGYVHIESMDDESFRRVYAKLLGEYVDKEGIVIDTRWNGGGRLHEDIEVLFSGDRYLTQEIHGRKSSEMPSRRWNKPSIMVIGEANYSNAHGTPWVYKHKKMGKLVGMPVPGTMSSVNWITLQDPSMIFGVPVVAFRTEDGTILENTQLEPDIKVANKPEDVVKGIDSQLDAAVRELLREIDGK